MTSTVSTGDAVPAVAPTAQRRSFAALMPSWSPKLVVGLSLAGVIVLWAIIGPLLVGDPNAISTLAFAPPGTHGHLLGTTQTGQDVWSQIAWGTRGSLIIGFSVGVLATVLSGIFGIVAAYLGGALDDSVALFTNVVLVIPGLPLTIVIGNYVPPAQRGIFLIAVVLALTSWAGSARVLRAVTLSIRSRDYVSASRVSGEKAWRILVVEILPNLIPVMASQFVFAIIFAILGEAGLSFLGLGANNTFTLGTILFQAYNDLALTQGAWWWFVPPGLLIALFGCALSLINFSIDEIINPKLRNSTRAQRKKWGLTPAQIAQLEAENLK
ncbi:ABC transporter permease [Gryllotalpicola protaetiae]|uniref:ABC transporter permease n=1 Tax=Gryllotalpicola protaetiae TaxID=2419771 RepID=A0A387BQ56_9MICO|nr:ABC transporter permease [Gryllotalpicola protaetiae]AYG03106.1 ABC transporter permease [Gryllotalpicola protaetiae]